MLTAAESLVKVLAPMMAHKLRMLIEEQEAEAGKVDALVQTGIFVHPFSRVGSVNLQLKMAADAVKRLRHRADALGRALETVSGETADLVLIPQTQNTLDLRSEIWSLCEEVDSLLKQWLRLPFNELPVPSVVELVAGWKAQLDNLATRAPGDEVVASLRERLEKFTLLGRILVKLSAPCLRLRHWRTLFAGMGRKYQPSSGFTIRTLQSLQVHKYAAVIDHVHDAARAEQDARELLDDSQARFLEGDEETEFAFAPLPVEEFERVLESLGVPGDASSLDNLAPSPSAAVKQPANLLAPPGVGGASSTKRWRASFTQRGAATLRGTTSFRATARVGATMRGGAALTAHLMRSMADPATVYVLADQGALAGVVSQHRAQAQSLLTGRLLQNDEQLTARAKGWERDLQCMGAMLRMWEEVQTLWL